MEYMDILWKKSEHANQQLTNCAVDKCSRSQPHCTHKMMFRQMNRQTRNGAIGWQWQCLSVVVAAFCTHHSHAMCVCVCAHFLPTLSNSKMNTKLPFLYCFLFTYVCFSFFPQTIITCVLRVLCTFDLWQCH